MNKNKKVVFTLHAEDKLKRLMKIGVTKEKVLKIIENPRNVVGYYGRKIAHGLLSEESEGGNRGSYYISRRKEGMRVRYDREWIH